MDDTEKTVEQIEEVANESPIATFQSKAEVTCRCYKRGEVNVETQYAWQDDPAKLSNNLEQDAKIAEKEEAELAPEELIEEFHEIDEQKVDVESQA